jgi:RNA polymerase sigma-70 factor, ECF subfamily
VSQPSTDISKAIDAIYRRDSRRVFATLIRLLGSFELAEEGLHEAFRAAVEQWPVDGVPANPVAWLVSAGRFKAIDQVRKISRFDTGEDANEHQQKLENVVDQASGWDDQEQIVDDRLRLIFTCCHPSLATDAQVALTLREVCGLTTEQIAHAYLTSPPTIAQRIVRAKAKIRDAKISYEVPEGEALVARLQSVLRVVYLVYNEGYLSSSNGAATDDELVSEAVFLCRLLVELLPHGETKGLLALTLLQESRRNARFDEHSDICLLDAQDRSQWDRSLITEGCALVEDALRTPGFGTYALQAAINAIHAEALRYEDTDWAQIVALYDVQMRLEPTPIVALNRAVAIGMRDGFEVGLLLINELLANRTLHDYHLAHAARADFCRRLGRTTEAVGAYRAALKLTQQPAERRFIEKRLAQLL